MRHRIIVLLTLAVVVALPGAAHAKGPAGGWIEGTGVDGVINVAQPGELGQGTPMSELVEVIGFFDLTFGESKLVMAEQPTKPLGESVITITWDMMERSSITQHIYLDAEGGPVTHVAPGQTFWDGWETVGGWMVVTGDLATPLIQLGVDESVFPTKSQPKKSPVTMTEQPVKSEPMAKAPVEKAATPMTVTAPAAAPSSSSAAPASSGPGVTVVVVIGLLAMATLGAGVWTRLRHPVPR